ncbi:histidine kinase [Demequina mangrovi]|uniref:Helicase/secretion neighborhood TadE-like protein n=1 Tax=Demequina mangrovi TaxID=1043493 RepID=A0A1H7AQF6_9MICO|nr:histidine kinase [Demequina mangrovi]SEJ64120.1 hypothetical protein SAMN05421637_2530 [Demequina mangrovi]
MRVRVMRRWTMRRWTMRGDRGAGTVTALGVACVAMLAVLALAAGLGQAASRGQAQAAADAGALAGAAATRASAARAMPLDAPAACEDARTAVEAAGAVLASCDVDPGGDVSIDADVGGSRMRSRAGWKGVGGGPG